MMSTRILEMTQIPLNLYHLKHFQKVLLKTRYDNMKRNLIKG